MKNNKLSWMLICIMMFGLAPVWAAWNGDYGQIEEPTKVNGYYEIYNENQLAWFSDKTAGNSNSENVKLMVDLDMGGFPFVPISAGDGGPKYSGIFDGNGHTIKNLHISSDSSVTVALKSLKKDRLKYAQNPGFIATLGNNGVGTLKNIFFENALIEATQDYGKIIANKTSPISVGIAVGWLNGGTVAGVQVSGDIVTSGEGQAVGGVVGYSEANASISDCYCDANIQTSGENVYAGGISGYAKSGVSISSVAYEGTVANTGTVKASGGIVGKSVDGNVTLDNCYYDPTLVPTGVADGTVKGMASAESDINSEDVVCDLNGGIWDSTTHVCSDASSDMWNMGQSDISFNGSDGYKVIFSANGGAFASGAKTTKLVAKRAPITADEIGIPTRDGYYFSGWSLDSNATESGNLGVATAKITVYAVWDVGYKVTFNAAPGKFPDSESVKTTKVAKGGSVTVDGFEVPTTYSEKKNNKYYFSGWTTTKGSHLLKTVTKNDTLHLADIQLVSDTALYAVWTEEETFTVTFNANGHGTTDVQFVVVVKGDTVNLPEMESDAGYKADENWYMDAECTVKYEKAPVTANLVLYAKWIPEEYSINYELEGGLNSLDNPDTYNVETATIVLSSPTREGYNFNGWYYDEAYTNKATQISAGTYGNLNLYAKWTKLTYTVRYLSGNTIPAVTTNDIKVYGEPLTLKDSVAAFSHVGCKQVGWSLTDNGSVAYAFKAKYTANEELILYPHWDCDTVRLTYELFGEADNSKNPSVYVGPDLVLLQKPSSSGRTFEAWYTDQNFNNKIVSLQNISGNLALYANWTFEINYNPGSYVDSGSGATAVKDKVSLKNDLHLRSGVDNFVRTNYTMDGWSTTDGGEKVYELGQVYSANKNMTLYPYWVENCDSTKYGAVTVYTYADRKEAVIDGTSSDSVSINEDVEVSSVVLNRTFPVNASGEYKFSTLVLPFSIAKNKVLGAEFYELKDVVDKKTVQIWAAQDTLQANTPYIIRTTAEKLSFNLDGETVKLNTSTMNYSKSSDGHWEFRGVYSYKKWKTGDEQLGYAYGYTAVAMNSWSVGQFVKNGAGAYIKPFRAYLLYTPSAMQSAPRFVLAKAPAALSMTSIQDVAAMDVVVVERDEESMVEHEEFLEKPEEDVMGVGKRATLTHGIRAVDRWFDMKGRALNGKPTVKGIYYYNGKRVMVK